MFDLSQHQGRGTRVISLVGSSGGTASGHAQHRISIVAPGGGAKVGRKKAYKAAATLASSQMAVALGSVNKSTKRKKRRKAGTGKRRKTGVRKGGVQKRSAKFTIAKGRVRLTLASGKRKTVSAISVVRQLPVATVTKAAQSLGRRKAGRRKRKKVGRRKKR